MHYRLKSLSLATATLLLSVTSPLLPFTLKFEPLVVQAQTLEELEPGAEKWYLEAYQLWLKGDYPATLEKLQQDLARFRKEGDRARVGAVLASMGMVYRSMGQHTQALEYSQQALALLREVGQLPNGDSLRDSSASRSTARTWEGRTLYNIGLVYVMLGQYTQAIDYSQQALAINREVGDRIWEGKSLWNIGFVYLYQGQYAKALEFFQQTLAINKEVGHRADQGVALHSIGSVYSILGQYAKALEFLQQALAIHKEVGYKMMEGATFHNIGNVYFDLEQYSKALEFFSQALAIHREVGDKREEGLELNRTIADFRSALTNPNSNAKEPAQKLDNWLIQPIEAALKEANAKTIIYAPDGQLRYIPLAALYDGNQWLVQKYRINNITALSLTEWNQKPQTLKILAGAFTQGNYSFQIGGNTFNFGGLPSAGKEVENLASTVPGTTKLFNRDFSQKDTVAQMSDYSILHFATHASFVTGQPEDSFILFGNGDRANFRDVETWPLTNTDLVVLSACETGVGGKLGDGTEILGFGYLMQQAGARAAIASLWSVDDGGTQVLMNAFYTAVENGMSKAEALRQAQIALITKDFSPVGVPRGEEAWIEVVSTRTGLPPQVSNNLNHPYYWAPFILIGNGL